MHEQWTDRLTAYLDDELAPGERAALETHLGACPDCAAVLDDLRAVVARAARASERDAPPSRDLWPGIAARLDTPGPAVVPFHAAPRAPRRVSLSIGQLAIAATLLIAVAAATTWLVRERVAPATATIQAVAEPEPTAPLRRANFADAQYDAAVADLERVLTEERTRLDPRTIAVLEKNLKTIDAAIAEASRALEQDPANPYLNTHLMDSRRRKLDLLRQATLLASGG